MRPLANISEEGEDEFYPPSSKNEEFDAVPVRENSKIIENSETSTYESEPRPPTIDGPDLDDELNDRETTEDDILNSL